MEAFKEVGWCLCCKLDYIRFYFLFAVTIYLKKKKKGGKLNMNVYHSFHINDLIILIEAVNSEIFYILYE